VHLIVWVSIGQDGSGAGIFARRYDSGRALAGAEFQVDTTTLGEQFLPAVAVHAGGDFVVTKLPSGLRVSAAVAT
jgi:serralysin